MSKFKINRIYTEIIFIFSFFAIQNNAARQCDPSDLFHAQCSETEQCDVSARSCQCLSGFERKNDTYCVEKVVPVSQSTPNYSSLVDNQGSGSLVAGILIPLFLIIFVICGIYVNRRYQILLWIRNKISRQSENYDEFMIGQDLDDDDPPLRC